MHAFNTYSTIMFTPSLMRQRIRHLARVLPDLQRQFEFDTLVVTGKSGIALGFALSMMTGIHMVAVRKGESSHGDMVEGDGHNFTRYAFFDDCVASGSTRDRVQRELDARAASRPGLQPAARVLTILYDDTRGPGGVERFDSGGPTYRVPGESYLTASDVEPFQL